MDLIGEGVCGGEDVSSVYLEREWEVDLHCQLRGGIMDPNYRVLLQ